MVKKKKAKQWFELIAPPLFGNKHLGYTLASDPKLVIGRRFILSAIDVLDDFSKYYLKISFKITKVENDKAYCVFDGLECTRDYIARMVVRRVRRIDSVIDRETKDGRVLRIKTIAITGKRVPKGIQRKIRRKVDEIITEEIKDLTMDEFIKKVISDELKEKIMSEVKKIYPLRHFEFRKIEVKK